MIGEVFKRAGYKTAALGKWHSGMQFPYHPNARGFDEFYGFCSGHWGNYFSPMLERNNQMVQGDGFIIDDFTQRAMNYIEQHQDERITLMDASDYLGVRAEKVRAVEDLATTW